MKQIDLESSEDDIQEIQQEISVLSTCASPFVTQYKESFLRGHKLWIVMEFLGGGSCLDLLKPGPFTENQIATIARELLSGLTYLHSTAKIHRDIKAANILLSTSGSVKLADFGVAAQLTNIASLKHTFVGTPFWMAPEVIQQAGYDFKADIWSLGITCMELANGEPPRAGEHPMKVLFRIPKEPPPRLEGGNWSSAFRDFVERCLVKEPERRPSAKDLLKHKFIRSAGTVESLRKLIERKKEWDQGGRRENHPRLYQETMVTMSPKTDPEEDEWVFDTIKASTVHKPAPSLSAMMPPPPPPGLAQPQHKERERPRKMSLTPIHVNEKAELEGLGMQRLDVSESPLSLSPSRMMSTVRRIPSDTPKTKTPRSETPTRPHTSHSRSQSAAQPSSRPPSKPSSQSSSRNASGESAAGAQKPKPPLQPSSTDPTAKKPLTPDMSFGNTASTVRLFRRVSDKDSDKDDSPPKPRPLTAISSSSFPVNSFPAFPEKTSPVKPRHSSNESQAENRPPSMSTPNLVPSTPVGRRRTNSGTAPHSTGTKEAHLGRRLYTKVVEPAFSELLASTSASTPVSKRQREAVGKVADAWTALDALDPEGEYALLKSIIERVGADPRLRSLLPKLSERESAAGREGAHSPLPASGPRPKTPITARRISGAGGGGVKSPGHRRRSSLLGRVGEGAVTEDGGGWDERAFRDKLPGREVRGMEHSKALADLLYGRWAEGLGRRWGGV